MNSPSVARWIPALTWLRTYDRTRLRGDVIAGVTLAAYLLPGRFGRRLACKPAAGSGALRMLIWRTSFLDPLRGDLRFQKLYKEKNP